MTFRKVLLIEDGFPQSLQKDPVYPMILRIIKINLNAVLALPFLLVATISELIARALEKIPLILRMICIAAIAVIVADNLRSSTGLSASIEFAIYLGVCAVIITTVLWVLSVFSSILDILWHFITLFFNAIYDFTYRIFLSLNESCENEYQILSFNGLTIWNGISCFCYLLLHGVDWLIVHLLWLSHALCAAASLGIAAAILMDRSEEIMLSHGIPLTTFLQTGSGTDVLYECVLLLAIIIPTSVILISLGREWRDWAVELRMDSMEYEEYIDSLQDYKVSLSHEEEPDEEALEMQDVLNDHTGTLDDLYNEIIDTLSIKNDILLKNQWNEYLKDLSDLIDVIEKEFHNEIPHREFKKMLYKVRHLDRQRNDLFEEIDRILELAENPANTSVFFTGCDNRAQLDKRYRELCKAYHPDSAGGDQDLFVEMQSEYKELKNIF